MFCLFHFPIFFKNLGLGAVEERGEEREVLFSFALNTNLCVSSALLDNDFQVFILTFVRTSLQEDII